MSRTRQTLRAVLLAGVGLVLASMLRAPGISGIDEPGAGQVPGTVATVTRRLRPADPFKWFEVNCAFPDGRRIGAPEDLENGGVRIEDLQNGGYTGLIPPGTGPGYMYAEDCAVSLDGSKVAYFDYSTEGDGSELRVVPTYGGPSRQIRKGPWMHIRGWTPDGSHVLVVEYEGQLTRALLVAESDGATHEVAVAGDTLEVGFSPDSRYIAYDEGPEPRSLFVLDLATDTALPLLQSADDDRMVGWSPDGGSVLFLRNRGSAPAVYRLAMDGGRAAGDPELVLPDAWGFVPVGFTTAGGYLYGLRTDPSELYVATLDEDAQRLVTPPTRLSEPDFLNATHPDWHPDGKQVAYLVHENPDQMISSPKKLMVRSLETGQVSVLPPPEGWSWLANPQWSADGSALFVSGRAEGRTQPSAIWRVDVDTGRSEVVVEEFPGRRGLAFDLSADGRYLYYAARGILRKDLRTGEESEVWSRGAYWLQLSPDGQTLLAEARNLGGTFFVPTNGDEPRRVPFFLHGGDLARASLIWSPDSRALLFLRRDATDPGRYSMYRMLIDGEAPPEPVGLEFEKPWVEWHDVLGKVRFDPDGRRVVFAAGLRTQELWVMENFLPDNAQMPNRRFPITVRLGELFDKATASGSATRAEAPDPVEWRFDEPQPGWRATTLPLRPEQVGLATVAQTDDALQVTLGPSTADSNGRRQGGVLVDVPAWDHWDWAEVLIQARSSYPGTIDLGFNVWGQDGDFRQGRSALQMLNAEWAVPLVGDGTVHTYRVPWAPKEPLWGEPIDQLAIWIVAEVPLTVEILSITVVPKEHPFADAPAGTWSASKEEAPALYVRAPGSIAFPVRVPPGNAGLTMHLGIPRRDVPVTFGVSITPKNGHTRQLFKEVWSNRAEWASRSIDLSEFAGQSVVLTLEAESEREGAVAIWRDPILWAHTPEPSVMQNFLPKGGR